MPSAVGAVDQGAGGAADLGSAVAQVRALAAVLAGLMTSVKGTVDIALDVARIDLIGELEALKSAAAAAQAFLTAHFATSQRAQQVAAGVAPDLAGRGIAAQIGLARQESPAKAIRLVGLARVLVEEMPHTLAALARGETSEWRATLIARETATLSRADRGLADAELAGPGGTIANRGDAGSARAARAIAMRLDPGTAWARAKQAERERRLTLRPAPDCMTVLTAHLPVAQGVAVYAALTRAADTAATTADDDRGRGQVMADELATRILHPRSPAGSPADAHGVSAQSLAVPMEIQLVIGDGTLYGNDDLPARITGYGPIPAPLGRRFAAGHTGPGGPPDQLAEARVWVRRLYQAPATGALISMDSRRRFFPAHIRTFVIARDEVCRTPWCDAPIRQIDHIVSAAAGGPTAIANAQGLCQACNLAKQAPGWRQTAVAEGEEPAAVTTVTPTGHHYTSESATVPAPFRKAG